MNSNTGADLVSLLHLRAAGDASSKGYRFLGDGETETVRLGHAQLHHAAAVLGARLRHAIPDGRNVLLAYPPGLEFLVGFFGCIHAGCVPVPVALPHPRRGCERLRAIALDCGAAGLLTSASGARVIRAAAVHDVTLDALPLVETDIDTQTPPPEARVRVRPEDVAFLQYTSGSTRSPRGVCVTHGNVMSNLAAIHEAEGNGPESCGVSWLPAYHDMGLIEGLLAPLYGGYDTVLFSHTAFLQRPMRWLRAISRFRATVSGGPNFAFDACLRRVKDEDLASLDLSAWQVAYCGSEPLRAATLQAFSDTFSCCGFRASSLRPVYGLAEATLLVTASNPAASSPRYAEVSKPSLAEGRFVPSTEGDNARTVVSCGKPARGVVIAVVEPGSTFPMPHGQIGEIVVAGPGVARGYFGPATRSASAFVQATIDGLSALWLRTGDLGCLHEDELYVTGRAKDVIIVRGRKLHPQDIEFSVQRLDPHRIAGVAAFGRDEEEGEGIVVLAELAGGIHAARAGGGSWQRWADEIRAQVYRENEVALASVAFVAPGGLHRTSSGKLMRYRCREAYAEDRLTVMARFDVPYGMPLAVETP
jgi:acyl-CoA synthetase (AMP-forming)/AMP-acid ligase II